MIPTQEDGTPAFSSRLPASSGESRTCQRPMSRSSTTRLFALALRDSAANFRNQGPYRIDVYAKLQAHSLSGSPYATLGPVEPLTLPPYVVRSARLGSGVRDTTTRLHDLFQSTRNLACKIQAQPIACTRISRRVPFPAGPARVRTASAMKQRLREVSNTHHLSSVMRSFRLGISIRM
ncbi:hypothetical protein EXIGLDRAFT_68292 [Exidia glandulosa HHB12029]|uniref:Uncharacterized protein n=1 Tax=Exidia glandulosa HHB12029 TaxID=1314781 RepID=A0A166MKP6_EXIGL|nr:hypothetical protein EXIGLDRAFT_68292 [Exidia glandulosa HHB12029]